MLQAIRMPSPVSDISVWPNFFSIKIPILSLGGGGGREIFVHIHHREVRKLRVTSGGCQFL